MALLNCTTIIPVLKRYAVKICDWKRGSHCYKHKPCKAPEPSKVCIDSIIIPDTFLATLRYNTRFQAFISRCCRPHAVLLSETELSYADQTKNCFALERHAVSKCFRVRRTVLTGPCCPWKPFCAQFRTIYQRICVRVIKNEPACCGLEAKPCRKAVIIKIPDELQRAQVSANRTKIPHSIE